LEGEVLDRIGTVNGGAERAYSTPSAEERLAQLETHYGYAVEQLQNARRHNLELGAQVERLTKELEGAGGRVGHRGAVRLRAFARVVLDISVRAGRKAVRLAYRVLGD
jgi:chromosome segregation ATPase